ncbi:CHAD domain-containing protein [Glaciihabitans tibetensis]|uniref:CHAD domain-containing protein n=1 Tax=Glaciihabitans tibetensis TaxID=1266600 RepID=A0A2T0VJU9_9MICO|nr:CYTH and CHAD domain-containing protein [Glaciihabitans tibetensis]PRY70488.1 CHAD domain-containing protein [Glaciihabitans tibetensis]
MTVTKVTETERKYEVDDTAQLPDLSTVPAIAKTEAQEPFTLRAVYFDTAGGALAAAGFTLRRREGGSDEGWHLKTPAPRGRTEHRVALEPPGDHTPPAQFVPPRELIDLVLARSRGNELVEVAHITTERSVTTVFTADADGEDADNAAGAASTGAASTASTASAEIADDRVAATDVQNGILRLWREWEVELLNAERGDVLDALEPHLLAAGASASRHPSKLARALEREDHATQAAALPDDSATALGAAIRVLWHLRDELLDADPGVRSDEPDAVHQMRIVIRRLRSVLAAFQGVLDPAVLDDLRYRLGQLGDTLGVVRDAEVRHQRASALIAPATVDAVHVRRRLVEDAWAEYESLLTSLLGYLSSAEYFALLDAIDALVLRPPVAGQSLAKARPAMRLVVRRESRRARRRLKNAHHDDLEALHGARKAARRLRYVAEALSGGDTPVLGKKTVALAKSAESVQDLLGEHRDATLFVERLRQTALQAEEAGESAADYDSLAEAERQHASQAVDALEAAVSELGRAAKA